MTDRQSRFARSDDAPRLVLTARDIRIVSACYEHQWLTRQQLQLLTGMPGVTRINQRLRQLYDHRYLDRIRAGTVGAGLQPVYIAGEAAVPLIAAETDKLPSEVRELLREDCRASAVLLPHDLQVNDVRIALTCAIQPNPGLRLDLWLNTRESYDAYTAGRSLCPDGYFRLWQGEVLSTFFLEVDRGTTSLPRWKAKVERYLDYRDGGYYRRRYGLQRFRVLTTALTPLRLAHLREATAEITSRSFWFALTTEVVTNPDLARPIWQPVGQESNRSLI